MAAKFAPRRIVQSGFVMILLGTTLLGVRAGSATSGWVLVPALMLAGSGIGIIASQINNLVQSSVTTEDSAETSGLMATFQNLGMSFGTAMSGVIMIGALLVTSTNLINQSTALNTSQKEQLQSAYSSQAQIMSNAQIEAATANQSLEVSEAVVSINAEARQKSLSYTFILLAVIAAFGLISTINLPANKPGPKALG